MTGALSAAKDLAENRQRKSHRAPPTRVFVICLCQVTQCHASRVTKIFFKKYTTSDGVKVRFDPELVREIMWQGAIEDKHKNVPEPFDYEQAFDEAGRSCLQLLWAALASKFRK